MTSHAARYLGKRGGLRTRNKYGVEHFKRISKLAVEARRLKASQKAG